MWVQKGSPVLTSFFSDYIHTLLGGSAFLGSIYWYQCLLFEAACLDIEFTTENWLTFEIDSIETVLVQGIIGPFFPTKEKD